MDTITHPELVAKLAKPGQDIINELTPCKAHCFHMASALMGEAGELFDPIKKWVIYDKKLDRVNIIEELGDMEFYMEGIRAALGITREETITSNIAKLSERYKSMSYSNEQAQERADKKDE